jgi:hypothetical protein
MRIAIRNLNFGQQKHFGGVARSPRAVTSWGRKRSRYAHCHGKPVVSTQAARSSASECRSDLRDAPYNTARDRRAATCSNGCCSSTVLSPRPPPLPTAAPCSRHHGRHHHRRRPCEAAAPQQAARTRAACRHPAGSCLHYHQQQSFQQRQRRLVCRPRCGRHRDRAGPQQQPLHLGGRRHCRPRGRRVWCPHRV